MENVCNQALERLRQEGQHEFKDILRNREFETSQGYMGRPCLKKRKGRKKRPFAIKDIKGYYRNH